MTGLERPFVSVHSRSALEREVEMTETLIEYDVKPFPDGTTPEEAYIAALQFVMNKQGSNVRDGYEDLMGSDNE
ncbi:hypothetical protein ACNZ70_001933 [Vibrio mimicus]